MLSAVQQESWNRGWTIFIRGVKRGVQSLRRERLLKSALASLVAVLVLTHIILLLVVAANAGIGLLRQQTDIRLEILDTASDTQIQDFIAGVRSLPYVQDVVYVTREQAYDRASKTDPQLTTFLTKFGMQNPFPETMGVRLKQLSDYSTLRDFIAQPMYSKVVDPAFLTQTTNQESYVYRLIDVVQTGRLLLFGVTGIALAILILSVAELVRRRATAKREEILVQRFVGAAPIATVVPFFTEILIVLVAASVVSIIVVVVAVIVLPFAVPALAEGGMFAPWATALVASLSIGWPLVVLMEIIVLPIVALLGSVLALWPELKTRALPFLN